MAITWGSGGVFGDIGALIKTSNDIEALKSTLDTRRTTTTGIFDDDADDVEFLSGALQGIDTMETRIDSAVNLAVQKVEDYMTTILPDKLEVAYASLSDMLDQLVEKMDDDSQTVDANTVSAGAVTFSGAGTPTIQDNGTPTAGQVTPTQMLIDDQIYRIECVSASEGADTWYIYDKDGVNVGTAETSTLFEDDSVGIEFTINEPVAVEANDGSNLVSGWDDLSGGIKSSNCDSDGKVYVAITLDGSDYTITGYPSSADRTADTNAVFASATYTGTGDVTVSEQNSSGISGTLTVDATGTDADIEVTLKIPVAVGDKFEMAAATVTDDGTIQTFFRDHMNRSLPSDGTGSETIADSLVA